MTTDLTTQDLPATVNLDQPMTSGDLMRQALLIQEILSNVMVDGIHYGIIPGTGEKKTLYQPGAEKICSTFRLAPKYMVDDLSEPHQNFYRYRVACSLYTIRDGLFVGSACGEATSAEEKYQWEKAVCTEHWETTDPTRRRIKFRKTVSEGGFEQIQQVQRNAADLANTVLKIACKRAFISATRGATAASDLLEVDLDDEAVGDLARDERKEQQTVKPKAKPMPAPKIPYGHYKDQQITDPEVPTDYLQWLSDKMAAGLQEVAKNPKHKRARFKAQDTLFLAALDAEIAFRKANQPKDEPQQPEEGAQTPQNPAKPIEPTQDGRKPFTESSWADFIIYCEEEAPKQYKAAKAAFLVQSGHDLPAAQRIPFYDQVMAAIEKAKK